MRQQNSNNSNRRARGRVNSGQSNRKSQSRGGVFDSNGPAGRIRGNASQIYDKYLQLARDAGAADDRIAAQSYYQFAEHYFRIMNVSTDHSAPRPKPKEEFRDPSQEEQPEIRPETRSEVPPEILNDREGEGAFAESEEEGETHRSRGPRGRTRGRGRRPRQDHCPRDDTQDNNSMRGNSIGGVLPAEWVAAESVGTTPVGTVSESPHGTDCAVGDAAAIVSEEEAPPAASVKRPRGRPRKKPSMEASPTVEGSDN